MRRVRLIDELGRTRPELADPEELIRAHRVFVDGRCLDNPASMVMPGCALVVERPVELRGSKKLAAALDRFDVDVQGRFCLDVGASAGGFTSELLRRGAERVYAVDVGHGQLIGALRQHAAVINLERTNVADLDSANIPDEIDLVTVDVSYLSLSEAVAQLDRVALATEVRLIGLVKPMFELRRATAPTDEAALAAALRAAVAGVTESGWAVSAHAESPERGAGGAREMLIYAQRA